MVKGRGFRPLQVGSSADWTPQAPTAPTQCLPPTCLSFSPGPGTSLGPVAPGSTAATGTSYSVPPRLWQAAPDCSDAQTPGLLESAIHTQGTQRVLSAVTEEPKAKRSNSEGSGSARRGRVNHSFTQHSLTLSISPSPLLCARHSAGT